MSLKGFLPGMLAGIFASKVADNHVEAAIIVGGLFVAYFWGCSTGNRKETKQDGPYPRDPEFEFSGKVQ